VSLPPNSKHDGLKLGLRLSHDSVQEANLCAIRVLDVFPDSPASEAGLEAYEDYMLGTEEVVFRNFEALASIFPNSDDDLKDSDYKQDAKEESLEALEIFVFHRRSASLRRVRLTPNSEWGGAGALGCDVGYGTAHKLPNVQFCTLDISYQEFMSEKMI
jgi:hypothetical protein